MNFSKQESLRIMSLWQEHGDLVTKIMNQMVNNYLNNLGRFETEWEMTRQSVELVAKRQALKEFITILETRYE